MCTIKKEDVPSGMTLHNTMDSSYNDNYQSQLRQAILLQIFLHHTAVFKNDHRGSR